MNIKKKPEKRKISRTLIVAISILVGITALYYIFSKISFKEVLEAFSNATPLHIGLYILVQVVMYYTLTFRWGVVLKSQGIKNISIFRLNNYKLVGYAVSFLTPTAKVGGEPVRAGLLSSRENIPFQKALSTVVIDKTLELTTSAMFFVLGGIILLVYHTIDYTLVYWIIGISIFFISIFGLFNYRMFKGKSFFHNAFHLLGFGKIKKFKKFSTKLKNFEKLVIRFYHKDRIFFFQAVIISLSTWILMFIEYYLAGAMLGQSLSPIQLFLVFSFVGAAYLVPIPMALGALEAGQISVFSLISIKTATGVGLALITRAKDMILALIGILLLVFYGLKFKDVVSNADRIDKEVERLKDFEEKEKNT